MTQQVILRLSSRTRLEPVLAVVMTLGTQTLFQTNTAFAATCLQAGHVECRYAVQSRFGLQNNASLQMLMQGQAVVIEVALDEEGTTGGRDYVMDEAQHFVKVRPPEGDGATGGLGVIQSMALAKEQESVIKTATVRGVTFRNDAAGHLRLGLVTVPDAEVYVPPRLASLPLSTSLALADSDRVVNLDRLDTSDTVALKWTLRSLTDAMVEQDTNGFTRLHGTVELALLSPNEPGLFVNLGVGATLVLRGLATPIELVDESGTPKSVTDGKYVRAEGGWRHERGQQ